MRKEREAEESRGASRILCEALGQVLIALPMVVVLLLLLSSKVLATTYQNANNKQEIPVVRSASHLTVHVSVSTSIFITIFRLSFSIPANDGPAKVRQTVRFIDA